MDWSEKQASYIAHSNAFINICDGAVRSGKTHAALARFSEFCLTGPSGDFAVFGKTERTVRRNVVYPLQDLLPGAIKHVQGSGELYVFGRRCHVIGANDARSEEKVRGLTLAGAYMNEVTLYPKEVFDQTLARTLSVSGARIFADCNPDSPYHWLATDYLEADHPREYLKRWRFRLTDNPVLPAANVEMLKALYGPGTLFYRRNIDGEWVMAEGAVYDMFNPALHVVDTLPGHFEIVRVGVDYGTSNPTAFVLLGKSGETWYAAKEHYYDSRATGRQKTDAEHAWDLRLFLKGIHAASIEVDPSAASFITQLRRDGVSGVRGADHAVLDGIRAVSTALTNGRLKIHSSCENLIKEMSVYAWDEKAQERGEDKPLKTQDHAPDALRYAAMRIWGKKPVEVYAF